MFAWYLVYRTLFGVLLKYYKPDLEIITNFVETVLIQYWFEILACMAFKPATFQLNRWFDKN